jgi:hypothetical protein
MFSDNKDIDYSLNRPCRTLSAVAPPSKSSSSSSKLKIGIDDDDINNEGDNAGRWDDNDNDDLDDDEDSDAGQLSNSHLFLVGTSIPSLSKLNDDNNNELEEEDSGSNSNSNRIHLLQYHEDSHELTDKSSYLHPTGEIWAMECHPTKSEWVVTCGGGAVYSTSDDESVRRDVPLSQFQTTLWKLSSDDIPTMNDDDDDNDGGGYDDNLETTSQSVPKLEPIITIPHGVSGKSTSTTNTGWEQRVGQIVWNPLLRPSNSSGDAMFDLAQTTSSSNNSGGNLITVGWDAHISPISLWDISSLSDVKEVWSTGTGSSQNNSSSRKLFGKLANMQTSLPRRVSWDPHDTHNILATSGVDVVAYDMRMSASSCSSGVGIIPSAHRYGVVDVCHNHSQTNIVLTSGMDGVIKFWDMRMISSTSSEKDNTPLSSSLLPPPPLLKAVRGGHSHWTTRAVYNPFHDQLVLSGGSDGIANLWRISSCSSAPLLELHGGDDDDDDDGELSQESRYGEDVKNTDDADDEDEDYMHLKESFESDNKENKDESSPKNESNSQDIRVTRHECSDVTADVAWSATDPWIYATLSYDGAIVIHHVPSKEKYKILL